MADRRPNQDEMVIGGQRRDETPETDATYRDASYLGTSADDDEEVRDLGFIVDDHDDRRATLTGDWQRLDDLDTDEPLETHRTGAIPHSVSMRERGAPRDWFATDFHEDNAVAEQQEQDFVTTSMLPVDPEMKDGTDDFTDESLHDLHGAARTTDIAGHVTGIGYGFGTSLTQDLGRDGFDVRDNPLVQPEGSPISDDRVSHAGLGTLDVDEMADEGELDLLVEIAARDAENGSE